MVNSRDRMEQTHKTILFESFTDSQDDEALDLCTFLRRVKEEDPINTLGNDLAKLEVRSFDEFLKKFSPKVYEYTVEIDDKLQFRYTTRKSEAHPNSPTVELVNHSYFKMLCDLYAQKAKRGLPNLEFDDSDILSRLLPQGEIKEIYSDRKVLTQLMRDYDERTARNEIASEEAARIDEMREKITEKYAKSPLPLLSIALADVKTKIERLKEVGTDKTALGDGGGGAKIAIGTMTLDDSGKPIFKELPSTPGGSGAGANSAQAALRAARTKELLELDYDDFAPEKNDTVKALVVSAYVPEAASTVTPPAELSQAELREEKEKLEVRKNELESLYTGAKNSFIETLAAIVQKLLCVKVFFDHATDGGGDSATLEGKAGLIVANCRPGDLLDPAVINNFSRLMEHFGMHEVKKRLWFAILPHVKKGSGAKKHSGMLGSRKRETTDKKPAAGEFANLTEAISILDIMKKARIVTFFNFEPTLEDTFGGISKKAVDENKSLLKSLNGNEYAVFVYPNFTLMADKNIKMPDSDEIITAPAVAIDASYVAAGMVVATQQARILKKHFGKKFLPENVNVHVDLENDDIASDFLSHFNCELAYNWDSSLKESINDNSFGFVFCGDEKVVPSKKQDSGELKNSYVYLARTMAQDDRGVYKPLYRTLTKNFLYSYAKSFGERTTKEQLKAFFKDVQDWELQAKGKSDAINLILQLSDTVKQDPDNGGQIKITFGKVDEILDLQISEEDKED